MWIRLLLPAEDLIIEFSSKTKLNVKQSLVGNVVWLRRAVGNSMRTWKLVIGLVWPEYRKPDLHPAGHRHSPHNKKNINSANMHRV